MRMRIVLPVLLLLLCTICTCAYAAESIQYNGDSFVISGTELCEWSDDGEPTTRLVIPADWGITAIGQYAFSESSSLEEIVIPEGVTLIDDAAFYLSQNLKRIVLPSTLKEIHAYAMSYTGIEEITIPVSVEMIGNQCFGACRELKEVYFEPGCKMYYFLSSVFTECTNLERVVLPDGFKSMDVWAFHNCHKLNDIVLPEDMTYLHDDVFSNAETVLISVYKDSLAHQHCVKNNIPFRLVSAAKVESVTIKNNYASDTNGKAVFELEVKTNKDTAAIQVFDDELGYQTTYRAGTVGAAVDSDGVRTWRIVRSLNRDGERRIILRPLDENDSSGADKHVSIVLRGTGMISKEILIEDNTLKPGESTYATVYTYSGASYLHLYAPNGTEIANYYYPNNSTATNGLREWRVSVSANYFGGVGKFDVTFKASGDGIKQFGYDLSKPIEVTADMILPETVVTIEEEAFLEIDARSVIIPDGCLRIEEKAFANSANLAYVYIPASVTDIESDAFSGCSVPLFIYGESGSDAEDFAAKAGYIFMVNGEPEGAKG